MKTCVPSLSAKSANFVNLFIIMVNHDHHENQRSPFLNAG